MTTNPKSQYLYETINPNTYVHHVLTCSRCKECTGLTEGNPAKLSRILCYPCYKELLKKV